MNILSELSQPLEKRQTTCTGVTAPGWKPPLPYKFVIHVYTSWAATVLRDCGCSWAWRERYKLILCSKAKFEAGWPQGQALSQVLRFRATKYIFRGQEFCF